jgi:hypothetical protein
MKLRNKWNLYHKLNFSYPFFTSDPLKQGIIFLHLVLKEIIKVWTISRYIKVWNVFSCMFSLFIESWLYKTPDVPKFLCLYIQFLGTYSGLYILSKSYLCMIYYHAMYSYFYEKIFNLSTLFILLYLLTWEQCLWKVYQGINLDQMKFCFLKIKLQSQRHT